MLRLTIDGVARVDGTTIVDGLALEESPATLISDGPVAAQIDIEAGDNVPKTVPQLVSALDEAVQSADGLSDEQLEEAILRVGRSISGGGSSD